METYKFLPMILYFLGMSSVLLLISGGESRKAIIFLLGYISAAILLSYLSPYLFFSASLLLILPVVILMGVAVFDSVRLFNVTFVIINLIVLFLLLHFNVWLLEPLVAILVLLLTFLFFFNQSIIRKSEKRKRRTSKR